MRICPNCQEEMTAWRVGDFDGGYYCSCDLTHVELDGRSIGGASLASVQDDTYDPWEGEDLNDVSLVPALEASLRLCGAEVPEPHLKESARTEDWSSRYDDKGFNSSAIELEVVYGFAQGDTF